MASFLARSLGLVVRPGETTLAPVAGSQVEKLDGLDASAFAPAAHDHDDRYFTETESDARYVKTTDETVYAYGQIREDASIRNSSSRVASVTHVGTGLYCVVFTAPVPSQTRLESSVVSLAGSGSAALFPRVTNGQGGGAGCASGQLDIKIVSSSGTLTNGRLSFIVP